MLLDVIILILTLGAILLGAIVFTNGIEWVGKKLNLGEGAVGSIFAAVGTAMPETIVPIVAILFGTGDTGKSIGIGAILGAPFMLGTLAFFVSGVAVVLMRKKRPDYPKMRVDPQVIQRDLVFFLFVYTIAVLCAFVDAPVIKHVLAGVLIFAYVLYVCKTIQKHSGEGSAEGEIEPCYFTPKSGNPHLGIILIQVALGLVLIMGGAYLFVEKVQVISISLGVPAFILALIIAPIATELPEKFNSVIWIIKGKDTLALGNITGAMVFQSSMITAIGILMTDWKISHAGLVTVLFTLTGAAVAYIQIRLRKTLTPATLLLGGAFYGLFLVLVFTGRI